MGRRLELQRLLENILGNKNVYFQPPSSVNMEYDAIRYSRSDIESSFADDLPYIQHRAYEVIAIYRNPDSDLPIKLSKLPKCSFVRSYVANNLNHSVFTLYY